jgi:hypothetical protein
MRVPVLCTTHSVLVVRAVASCTSVVAGLWSYIVRHLRVPVDLSATQVDHIAKFAIRVLSRRALGTDGFVFVRPDV